MSIVKEGYPFIVVPVATGILLLLLFRNPLFVAAGVLLVMLGLFCAFFFRDPSRSIPDGENLIVSPCDGTVMEVTQEGPWKVIRVFLSVFNVHLQRSPFPGTVQHVEYRPGKFLPAMNREAHSVNEQNIITLQTAKGDILVKQIAGILARRVVAWVKPGDALKRGEKIGLIKFSSQVDLYLPPVSDIRIKAGDKVTAGETVMGELK